MKVHAGEFERIYDPSLGERERWYVNDHCFARDDAGTWHLFGITHAEPANPHDEKHLAHATAPSLLGPWTKEPSPLAVDPSLDETVLWAPHVIRHDGRFWMFVCGGGPGPTQFRIHLATSPDCRAWTRHPANPLRVDGFEARDPMVLRVGGRWVLYYTATSTAEGGNFVVVAAESDDLVRWEGRRIVYRDPWFGTMAGPTESPFVVARDGLYFLFIGPDWGGLLGSYARTGRWDRASYRRTRVFASEDPLHFDPSAQVGTIDAHAAEVIVDERGESWISHCGWGQGGVYLAPLFFDGKR